MEFSKKVLVAGAGISGIGAADLLLKLGAQVILYDGNEKLDKEAVRSKFAPEAAIEIWKGELTAEMASQAELCVISPGIPLEVPFVKVLQEAQVPIWSEIELAYRAGKGKLAQLPEPMERPLPLLWWVKFLPTQQKVLLLLVILVSLIHRKR